MAAAQRAEGRCFPRLTCAGVLPTRGGMKKILPGQIAFIRRLLDALGTLGSK